MSLTNVSVLPSNTLLNIILRHKSDIGDSIGAIIIDAEVLLQLTTSPPTVTLTASTDSGYWRWIVIGACGGAVLILVIIILIIW